MIGAAHLSGIKNGIVIDIGVIVNGRSRQTQTVIMSFSSSVLNTPVTDTVSLPLGGGTIIHVNEKEHTVQVEPDSVAYRFDQEALAFGGKTMTGTDIAFAAGLATGIGHCSVKLSSFIVEQVLDYVKELVTRNIERMKTNIEPVPVVLCGGGSILIDIDQSFPDVTQMVRIDHFAVCNAVGAVLCLISASMDLIFDLLPSPVDGDQQRKHVIDQLIVDVCQPPIYIDLTKKRPTFDGNGVWCIDSIVLGSGGGGKYKMRVVPTSYFAASSDLIVGAGFMGAPTVSHELLPNGHECLEAVIFTGDIGGANGIIGLLVAVKKDIFCIDGDAMGRAFPYLNQCLSSIHGLPATPSWLCDVRSGTIIGTDESISNSQELEEFFRKECTERGLCVGVAFPPIHGTAWS
ncbi:unnamed protein product [Rotaria magnacalcarata]|nr:unnamed protein product [Rotaria magnacalcarata]CAF4579681.1 unnamed protein product [Rotaria magnacalcarata]